MRRTFSALSSSAPIKTLVVKYLPSGLQSNTKLLLDIWTEVIPSKSVETLDLLDAEIPFFTLKSMNAYKLRQYMGKTLSSDEAQAIEPNDKLIAQLKSADIIVMAYPMHNFSMPGRVKSYLDAVMMAGVTFSNNIAEKKMAGKKALTLFTSGGTYSPESVSEKFPHWDTLTQTAKINFRYMGYDEVEVLSVASSWKDDATKTTRLNEFRTKAEALSKKWYS